MSMSEAFLSLLYLNKTLSHKSPEWSSLVTGPGLSSSPPEAKNARVFHSSATTWISVVLGGKKWWLRLAAVTALELSRVFQKPGSWGGKGYPSCLVLPVPAPARKPWADTQGKLAHSAFSRDLRWAGRTNRREESLGPWAEALTCTQDKNPEC